MRWPAGGMDATKRPWQGSVGGPPMKRAAAAGAGGGSGAVDDELVEQAAFSAEADDLGEDEDTRLQMADIDVDLGEAGRNWERPLPPPLDPHAASISARRRTSCTYSCRGPEAVLLATISFASCNLLLDKQQRRKCPQRTAC